MAQVAANVKQSMSFYSQNRAFDMMRETYSKMIEKMRAAEDRDRRLANIAVGMAAA